jgi:hypothetical protein
LDTLLVSLAEHCPNLRSLEIAGKGILEQDFKYTNGFGAIVRKCSELKDIKVPISLVYNQDLLELVSSSLSTKVQVIHLTDVVSRDPQAPWINNATDFWCSFDIISALVNRRPLLPLKSFYLQARRSISRREVSILLKAFPHLRELQVGLDERNEEKARDFFWKMRRQYPRVIITRAKLGDDTDDEEFSDGSDSDESDSSNHQGDPLLHPSWD